MSDSIITFLRRKQYSTIIVKYLWQGTNDTNYLNQQFITHRYQMHQLCSEKNHGNLIDVKQINDYLSWKYLPSH